MQTWKGVIGLLALLICLITAVTNPAHGQAPPAPATTKLHVGQAFPYQVGVGIELTTYNRIRERLTLADLVIASKNRLNDSLASMLWGERALRQLDVAALQLTERELARSTSGFQQLSESYERAVTAAAQAAPSQLQRPLLFQKSFWKGLGWGSLVTAVGVVVLVAR